MFRISNFLALFQLIFGIVTDYPNPSCGLGATTQALSPIFFDLQPSNTNVFIQILLNLSRVKVTCGAFMLSGHVSTLNIMAHFFSLYTNYHWTWKAAAWILCTAGSFPLLFSRIHYSSDILITMLIVAGAVFVYHSAICAYHCYSKLGWMGYDWSDPSLAVLRVIWFTDGLNYNLLAKKLAHESPV